MKKTILLLFIACNALIINAQKGWELGALFGTMHYFGDLNTSFDLRKPGLAGSAVARYNFNNRICMKFSGTIGNISADDARSKNEVEQRRNLNFRSPIKEGAFQMEFNFLDYVHGSKENFYTPYLFGGTSVFSYDPKTTYNGKSISLRPLGIEGQMKNSEYRTTALAFVYGGGWKLDINDKWSMNLEISARKVFTDYLDDVSGLYPDLRDVKRLHGEVAAALVDRSVEPKVGQAGRQRGNGKKNDAYVTTSIGIVYYFGGLDCPNFYR